MPAVAGQAARRPRDGDDYWNQRRSGEHRWITLVELAAVQPLRTPVAVHRRGRTAWVVLGYLPRAGLSAYHR